MRSYSSCSGHQNSGRSSCHSWVGSVRFPRLLALMRYPPLLPLHIESWMAQDATCGGLQPVGGFLPYPQIFGDGTTAICLVIFGEVSDATGGKSRRSL